MPRILNWLPPGSGRAGLFSAITSPLRKMKACAGNWPGSFSAKWERGVIWNLRCVVITAPIYGWGAACHPNFTSHVLRTACFNLVVLDCAAVTIGNDVLIGPNGGIYTAGHPVDPGLRRQGLEFALPITIEDGVWIGGHAVIAPGVRIGRNYARWGGGWVTKDIPANVVAVGNPCRVVRSVTEKDREVWDTGENGEGPLSQDRRQIPRDDEI